MKKIKIGLIEDQHLFREGVKSLLGEYPEIDIVFESPDGFSVQERLKSCTEIPDVMLIDLTLPKNGQQEYSGWKVLNLLNQLYPNMRKLILSVSNELYVIAKLIEEGAHGHLAKDVDLQELHDAITHAHYNGSYINSKALHAIQGKMSGRLETPVVHKGISTREREVLELVCQGKKTKDIAEVLFISEKTVNGHRNNLLQKTGVGNVAGLVMYAVKNNLVEIV